MNKYKKALEALKIEVPIGNQSIADLQELVDKATPKHPTKDYSISEHYPSIKFVYICPNCGEGLSLMFDEEPNESDEYCSCCGQHIDWSEYE